MTLKELCPVFARQDGIPFGVQVSSQKPCMISTSLSLIPVYEETLLFVGATLKKSPGLDRCEVKAT